MENKIKDGRVYITGVAVREGVSRNDRRYIAKELLKFTETMRGRPIMKDHSATTDNIIGKVTEGITNDGGKTILYKGWVKGQDVIEKLRDGRLSEVSIGAFSKRLVRDPENENYIIPIDMEMMELSVTPIPGVRGTSITMPKETAKSPQNTAFKAPTINDNSESRDNTRIETKSQELNNKKEFEYNEMVDYKVIAELQAQIEALKKKKQVVNTKDVETTEDLTGYVIEQSESGRGMSFYKYY